MEVVPRLRSHGGESEQWVPMLVNRPLNEAWAAKLAAGKARNPGQHFLIFFENF